MRGDVRIGEGGLKSFQKISQYVEVRSALGGRYDYLSL